MEFIQSLAHATPLYAYGVVFFLMLLNGIFNAPSSQLLYAFVGYLSTAGVLHPFFLILFGGLGNIVGNIFLYEIVRKTGTDYLSRFITLNKSRADTLRSLAQRSGVWYIFFGKLIPAIKVTVPIVAGFTALGRIQVYTALVASSFIWAAVFVYIGIFFGIHSQFTLWYGAFALLLVIGLSFYTYKKYPHLFAATDTK